MTNLKAVNVGFNKFCGPAVLSILTGRNTDECAREITKVNGSYDIAGVLLSDLIKAADRMGFDSETKSSQGSLYRTLISLVNDDGMYIVTIPKHFVCIEIKDKRIYFCDNHTKEPIPAASSARLGLAVLAVNKVTERPKPVKTEAEILAELLEKKKRQFVMEVEAAALEVMSIARDISKAIGDISYAEAQEAIIKEFAERIK